MPVMTYRDALRSAMAEEMERDESVVLLGEDIGVYGGTHLVTDGLLDRFGPKRVIDTPIAEGGFTGAAIGTAPRQRYVLPPGTGSPFSSS